MCICLGFSRPWPVSEYFTRVLPWPGAPCSFPLTLSLFLGLGIRVQLLASVSPGRKGGELASAVHAYTKTGDPSMRSLVQHILSLVSHPVLSFLYRWIYDGELEDTHHEVRARSVFLEQRGAGHTHGPNLGASPRSSEARGAPTGQACGRLL